MIGHSKVFVLLQLGGCVPLIGLLVATITAHVLISDDFEDNADSGKTKALAVRFTSSYAAIVVYGFATTVSLLFVVGSPLSGNICAILYSAADAFFITCAGGVLAGSQLAAFNNGGGVAMMAFMLFLLTLKMFPMVMVKFNVLATSVNKSTVPFIILMFTGIGVVATGAIAILGAAATVLAIYIRVLYHSYSSDDINVETNWSSFNIPMFLTAGLLISFSCLFILKDKLTALTVDVINMFTQIFLGYTLNWTIDYLYDENYDWKYSNDKTFVFYYNATIALTVFAILMIIASIFIGVLRPFLPIKNEEIFEHDERKPLVN